MPNASARPRWNPWIALGGAAVLVALAVGLLSGGGAKAATGTTFGLYEDSGPPPITNLSWTPQSPVKGKGFKVTFTAAGQVNYRIYAEDLIGNRWILERGSANGTKTTAKIGKRLKAGQYDIVAGRQYPGRNRFGREIWYDELYTPIAIKRR